MSLLAVNVEGVPDLEVVPANEYRIKIEKAMIKQYENEKGKGEYLQLIISLPEEPLAKPIYHSLFMPSDKDDQIQSDSKKRRFKAFFEAFELPLSGETEIEELSGMEAWAYLKIKPETEDNEESNYIAKFIPGRN